MVALASASLPPHMCRCGSTRRSPPITRPNATRFSTQIKSTVKSLSLSFYLQLKLHSLLGLPNKWCDFNCFDAAISQGASATSYHQTWSGIRCYEQCLQDIPGCICWIHLHIQSSTSASHCRSCSRCWTSHNRSQWRGQTPTVAYSGNPELPRFLSRIFLLALQKMTTWVMVSVS